MGAAFLNNIDWQRPWLMPLLPQAQSILQSPDWRAALNDAATSLKNHRGLPIKFVPQGDLPPKVPYEAFISETGQVPTRENLHDFFNAMVWLTYPRIKAQLNELQATEIARASGSSTGIPPHPVTRGRLRDAATIFDENAAILISRDPDLVNALRKHEWHELFVARREGFVKDCEVRLFGHALMEKLVSPYKAITSHAWIVEEADGFFERDGREKQNWLDREVASQLTYGLSTSAFTPLPVLGVPGWCENQQEIFYEDKKVFRPKKFIRE
jgi:hypothetical protein